MRPLTIYVDSQRHKQVQKHTGNHVCVQEYMHIVCAFVQVYHPHRMTEAYGMKAYLHRAHSLSVAA